MDPIFTPVVQDITDHFGYDEPSINQANRIRNLARVKWMINILQEMGVDFDAPFLNKDLFRELHINDHCGNNVYPITLYYKELTIKNNSGLKLKVYDTYVRIYVDQNGFVRYIGSSPVTILRTTATRLQYINGYVHSHPEGTKSFHMFNRLCCGTGPLYKMFGGKQYLLFEKKEKFIAFVLAIKNFIEWEDNRGTNYDNIRYSIGEEDLFKREVPRDHEVEELVISRLVRNNHVQISVSQSGIDVSFDRSGLVSSIRKEGGLGSHLIVSGNTEIPGIFRRPILTYKGKPVFIKIIDGDILERCSPEFESILMAKIKSKVFRKLNEQTK